MGVKAFLILRKDSDSRIPRYLLSSTGPYLFRSEAENFIRVIRAATGYNCSLSVIEIERMLGEVVRFNGRWLITNVWDIIPTKNGFMGKAVINGKKVIVQRSLENPWQAVEPSRSDLHQQAQ